MVVRGASNTQGHVCQTVTGHRHETTIGQGKTQERTGAAEFSATIRNPTDTIRIVFSQSTTTPALVQREAGDLVNAVNIALAFRKVPTHVKLQRLSYNENGNLSGLM